jgi:hypothetical protein
LPIRKLQRLKPKHMDDSLALKPVDIKIPLATHEEFMRYLGHLDPVKLLDGIDNMGDDGE